MDARERYRRDARKRGEMHQRGYVVERMEESGGVVGTSSDIEVCGSALSIL